MMGEESAYGISLSLSMIHTTTSSVFAHTILLLTKDNSPHPTKGAHKQAIVVANHAKNNSHSLASFTEIFFLHRVLDVVGVVE